MKKVNPLNFFNSTREAIIKMTEITNNHFLTPEIRLRLITPQCPLWDRDYRACPFPDPFWAFYWPGGEALTRFVLDNGSIIRGKHVLDLGSGCGSSAIAAATLGSAGSVTANDIDPIAAVAIELNASLNNCKLNSLKINTENLIGRYSLHEYNCILVGDMFYNEEFNNSLMKWLLNLLKDNVNIYIGDPGRHEKFSKEYKQFVEKVDEYDISPEYMKQNDLKMRQISVWKLISK